MDQKINGLKNASKVIAVITKIGYVAMIVMICICAAMLIFLAVTGGETSGFTVGGIDIIAFDESTSATELAAICPVLIVMGGLFLAMFLLAHRMFLEISQTGDPFEEKYVKTIRIIGILTAATPIVVGAAKSIASLLAKTDIPEMYSDIPGMVAGAIIFCLSYIIAYGCGLKKQSAAKS